MDNEYTERNCAEETGRHIAKVQQKLTRFITDLNGRGLDHDMSKLGHNELPGFTKLTPLLKGSTYGSPEYRAFLVELKDVLAHHYAVNRHHPEHFQASWYPNWPLPGIECMTLVDLMEMLSDWMAAAERHADGDVLISLIKNLERFHISHELYCILRNTVASF